MTESALHGATIVFDLDGTLADSAPDLIRATNDALRHAGYPAVTETVIRPGVAYGARAMVIAALASLGHEPDEAEAAQLADSMVEFYAADIAAATALYPGCRQALDGLIAEGARLGLCTNKREGLARELLRELGILDHFHGVAGSDTYDFRKPDPRHLIRVIEAAGGAPARALMVGDTAADTGAARGAGVPSIAVTFGYSPVMVEELGADGIIGHYDELLPLARNFLIREKGV